MQTSPYTRGLSLIQRRNAMAKGQVTKKTPKKKPAKTLIEKRNAKKEKKKNK